MKKILAFQTHFLLAFLGAALFLCLVQFFPKGVGYLGALTTAIFLIEISFHVGFFISHSDMAGPYTTIIFGFTNTMANLTGIIGPLIMASLVSEDGKEEEWQNVFYVAAAILAFSGVFYLLFGSSNRQFWAGGEDTPKQFLCFFSN